ncbi:hypothetical protein BBJ29_001681 [Phytophthora kernoviae]|uniref:Uncharacterized protein n=1 Tax=Phytophthora kernoviae TaxID=325452 RepID=A0A3F2S265_9STRA|nr:hypothetical protein BBJ29_001681 [Phytophthora kernoviae]RLN68783.1 hypothetical protein BBP00_00000800 [Phytophthora kernoviae]
MRRRPGHPTAPADVAAMQREYDDGGDPAIALVKAVAGKALKSPKVRVGLVLWAVGLFFMLLAPGLRTVTADMKATYEGMVIEAANMPEYHEAYAQYREAQSYADEAKVWFWRFREPYKTWVNERQPVADKWAAEVARTEQEREDKMKKARSYVGLWSDFGLADVRARFWGAFEKGKMFAQQQTFYHMIMRVLSARDEDVLSMVLNWVFVAVMNFTTGLLGALFYFFFSLVNMVFSYQPDPLSATAFVVLGFIGAASVVASYLFALYGMVASGVYVVGKVVVRDALEQERRQQQLRNERQQ